MFSICTDLYTLAASSFRHKLLYVHQSQRLYNNEFLLWNNFLQWALTNVISYFLSHQSKRVFLKEVTATESKQDSVCNGQGAGLHCTCTHMPLVNHCDQTHAPTVVASGLAISLLMSRVRSRHDINRGNSQLDRSMFDSFQIYCFSSKLLQILNWNEHFACNLNLVKNNF